MRTHTAIPFFFLFFFAARLFGQTAAPIGLQCEHHAAPLGLETPRPRLSWHFAPTTERGVRQTAYEIRVARSENFDAKNLLWQSGKVTSAAAVLVPYSGPALSSGQRCHWQVRTWDQQGRESAWSAPAMWEMGLLSRSDWRARWIESPTDTARFSPALLMRREFTLPKKKIATARAYMTAHGLYEFYINGQRVGDQLLTPGWTTYRERLQYQVYDVTAQLRTGANAAGAYIGHGWYRGSIGWMGGGRYYGDKPGLLAQIRIRYTDGTEEWVVTDANWRMSTAGPIRMDDIYHGETYDARLEQTGWNTTGFDDRQWKPAVQANDGFDNLVPSVGPAVRRIEEIKPRRIFRTPKGELVADFGQNMVGWVRLKVQGAAGTTIVIRHAEVLDKKGNFYTENLRSAKCLLTYTLKGGELETYEPRFTFMGFRYAAIEGFPGELKPENLTGVVVHSDMPSRGTFTCSNPLLEQLQHNIRWGQKGNFLDVPTDCPQRDERMGWTGDAQAFCRTAAFNYDVSAFFAKWLGDVAADQGNDGAIPVVVPSVLKHIDSARVTPSAGWSDVVVIAPWTMYLVYGDAGLLETQYPSMKAWVEYMRRAAGDSYLWKKGSLFGDWLYYHPPVANFTTADGHTDYDYISAAFFAYSTQLLSRSAAALGKTAEAAEYAALFEKIKAAFLREYVTPSGRIASDSQTAYVLALMFGLLPDEVRPMAAKHLVADIKRRNNHLSTGFLGTPYLCHVLSENGETDVAYDLLLQESYPSWLYPVKMGATTIWERWDGQRPDSTFQEKSMNSFNHYAYGAIGDWMYRTVAGLEIGEPGYRHILIQPHPTDRLKHAMAAFATPYGTAESGWATDKGRTTIKAVIPPNTTATIRLPTAKMEQIKEGGTALAGRADFQKIRVEGGKTVFEVGSGSYSFEF